MDLASRRVNRLPTSTVESCDGPIDRIALLQIIHGPDCNIEDLNLPTDSGYWSANPIPTQSVPLGFTPDFTGIKRGGAQVVGYFGKVSRKGCAPKSIRRHGKNRHYWVIRCSCSAFQLINHKTLRFKPEGGRYLCARCCQVRNIQRGFGDYKTRDLSPDVDSSRAVSVSTEGESK